MSMKNVVLYHGGCRDGFCAAWVARNALGKDTVCIPVQYGQPVPKIENGSMVYIVDFSYPKDVLLTLHQRMGHLTVLDHHKTAQADLSSVSAPDLHITFDMNKSGGRLTWEHFYDKSGMRAPWLVDYTEDRDLWRWKLPDSRAVSAFLASHADDFGRWDALSSIVPSTDAWMHIVGEGTAILRYQQQLVDAAVSFAVEKTIAGHKVLVVNSTVCASEIAGELAKDRPFGVVWFQERGGKFVYSLRSREGGMDVSEVAKRFGGGGHKAAAGFTVDRLIEERP
jgi:oligoribonuclease NrnB/cAMP/cGMP phosphodiesterase (DHH superfamily)